MSDVFDQMRDLIQEDVGKRGLRADPERNLVNACRDDFRAACRTLAEHQAPGLAVITGFFIPTATPPAGETDGPLGALFLARAFVALGIPIVLVTDDFCVRALEAGLGKCGLRKQVPIVTLPTPAQAAWMSDTEYWDYFKTRKGIANLSHLLAIERVGPSHTRIEVPAEHRDRCHTMRGRDITDLMSPAHRLLEHAGRLAGRTSYRAGSSPVLPARQEPRSPVVCDPVAVGEPSAPLITIGIGDGGNEIGMGKIPWDVIDRNIPNGGMVACRVPTEHLIVAGVSNWGAYALAAGIARMRGKSLDSALFDSAREQEILEVMVEEGPLVDGVTGKPAATVDGLTWPQYAEVLTRIGSIR